MNRFAFILFLALFTSLNLFASVNQLNVGISTSDVTPEVNEQIPLGGYGSIERRNWPPRLMKYPFLRMFRAAKGELDPLRVKSMYLEDSGNKLLFVSLDVIGVTSEMREDLFRRLKSSGIPSTNIFVSGTHTHAGPGALSNNLFWQIFAMDRFQRKYYEKYMSQIMATINASIRNVSPAELYTLSFPTVNLIRNRRGNDRPIDPTANLLMARTLNGEWLGGIVNYAVHGTSLGAENLFFSADTPGAIERELEKFLQAENGVVRLENNPGILFINGAEGDVSPNQETHTRMGEEFALQTAAQWNNLRSMTDSWSVIQKTVSLGKPSIVLKKCVDKNWMPKNLKVGLGKFINTYTVINQIRFGSLWFLTWPGEATTELGMQLRQVARDAGAHDAWILGLTNDHLAYFTTPDEFEKGGYESCVNFFGTKGGETIIKAHQSLSIKNRSL